MPGVPIALHNAAVAAALETLGEDATVVWAEVSPGETETETGGPTSAGHR